MTQFQFSTLSSTGYLGFYTAVEVPETRLSHRPAARLFQTLLVDSETFSFSLCSVLSYYPCSLYKERWEVYL